MALRSLTQHLVDLSPDLQDSTTVRTQRRHLYLPLICNCQSYYYSLLDMTTPLKRASCQEAFRAVLNSLTIGMVALMTYLQPQLQ